MTIHLSEQREQLILSLVRAGKFASAEEVVDEGLRLVEQRLQYFGETKEPPISGAAGDTDDRTAQQLGNLRRLGEKLDAMPASAIGDGLSNRDHDRIIYGQ
jgi:Arc/MetJ-type ribon-helix-helix transcriptional regulator